MLDPLLHLPPSPLLAYPTISLVNVGPIPYHLRTLYIIICISSPNGKTFLSISLYIVIISLYKDKNIWTQPSPLSNFLFLYPFCHWPLFGSSIQYSQIFPIHNCSLLYVKCLSKAIIIFPDLPQIKFLSKWVRIVSVSIIAEALAQLTLFFGSF